MFRIARYSLFLLLNPLLVFAQDGGMQNPGSGGMQNPGSGFQNPLKYRDIYSFLAAVLDVLITIAFPILVLFIVYTGFLFVAAQGNETKLATAKKVLLWTIIGALLVLGAAVLSRAIQGTVKELRADGGAIHLTLK